jgi:Phosphodiester glycosidase
MCKQNSHPQKTEEQGGVLSQQPGAIQFGAIVAIAGCLGLLPACTSANSLPTTGPAETATPHYQVQRLPHATLHTLWIPASSRYRINPMVAASPQDLSRFTNPRPERARVLAVLNGGFFDPSNGLSTSFVTVEGQLQADPRQNPRLTQNPNLAPYLPKIWNRSELRQYQCGNQLQYGIQFHNHPIPNGCQLRSALGAGPQLLPRDTSEAEGFIARQGNQTIRDAINSNSRNARTAIGIKPDQSLLWVMVAQTQANGGMTLAELAEFLQRQGVTVALNLDGGSSSGLFYQGQTHKGKRDSENQAVLRPVKSVLVLEEVR